MKNKFILILFFIYGLISCNSIKKTVIESYKYEMYIDFKNISYQGYYKTQELYFEIDSVNGMWYDGKLIINRKDTLLLHGFEKGGHYVTTYKHKDSLQNNFGRFEIWCRGEAGQIRDSLTIKDADQVKGIIKETTTLQRRPRTICR